MKIPSIKLSSFVITTTQAERGNTNFAGQFQIQFMFLAWYNFLILVTPRASTHLPLNTKSSSFKLPPPWTVLQSSYFPPKNVTHHKVVELLQFQRRTGASHNHFKLVVFFHGQQQGVRVFVSGSGRICHQTRFSLHFDVLAFPNEDASHEHGGTWRYKFHRQEPPGKVPKSWRTKKKGQYYDLEVKVCC